MCSHCTLPGFWWANVLPDIGYLWKYHLGLSQYSALHCSCCWNCSLLSYNTPTDDKVVRTFRKNMLDLWSWWTKLYQVGAKQLWGRKLCVQWVGSLQESSQTLSSIKLEFYTILANPQHNFTPSLQTYFIIYNQRFLLPVTSAAIWTKISHPSHGDSTFRRKGGTKLITHKTITESA